MSTVSCFGNRTHDPKTESLHTTVEVQKSTFRQNYEIGEDEKSTINVSCSKSLLRKACSTVES